MADAVAQLLDVNAMNAHAFVAANVTLNVGRVHSLLQALHCKHWCMHMRTAFVDAQLHYALSKL